MFAIIITCWKGDRAVYGTGLENQRAGNGTVGSNPTPSATRGRKRGLICYNALEPDQIPWT